MKSTCRVLVGDMVQRCFSFLNAYRVHQKNGSHWFGLATLCILLLAVLSALAHLLVLGHGFVTTNPITSRKFQPTPKHETFFFQEPSNFPERLQWTSWTLAAEFLGVEMRSSSSFIQQSIKLFYGFCYGIEVSLLAKTAYIIVPKCGSNAFLCNLRNSPAFSDGDWVNGMNPEDPVGGLQRISCHSYADFTSESLQPFTAVGHPVDRFISALNEIEMRESNQCKRNTSWCSPEYHRLLRAPLGSAERLTEFLKYLLEGRLIPISEQVFHMFAVSGLFRYVPGTWVVRLEKMTHSWTEFVHSLGLNVSAWQDICGHSYDFMNVKEGALQALGFDANLHKALCALYMIDYVNFEYELPVACKHEDRLKDLRDQYLEAVTAG